MIALDGKPDPTLERVRRRHADIPQEPLPLAVEGQCGTRSIDHDGERAVPGPLSAGPGA